MSLLIVSLAWGAGGLLDVVSIQAGIIPIGDEVLKRRWDLLRLTTLPHWGLVRAKHAAARLRVWRMTSLIVGVRLAVLGFSLLADFAVQLLTIGRSYRLESLILDFVEAPIDMLVTLLTVGAFVLWYVLEPFWRMQALTGLGLWISTRVSHHTMAMLAGFGAALLIWILQAVLLGLLYWFFYLLLSALSRSYYVDSYDSTSNLFFNVAFCFIVGSSGLSIFGFFRLLQSLGLRGAQRQIAWMD